MSFPDGVLVIVPAYNEQENIRGVVSALLGMISSQDILVINDGSTDSTSPIAAGMGVTVVNLPFNLGIGTAVQTGYLYACRKEYRYVVRVDGDGQHRPDQIPRLCAPLLANEADIVIGSRYLDIKSYRSPFARRAGIGLLARLVSLIIRATITDATSGFTAINRRAISILADLSPDEYPEVESIVLLHKYGLRIGEIGVRMKERSGGISSITVVGSIYYMMRVMLGVFVELLRRRDGDGDGGRRYSLMPS